MKKNFMFVCIAILMAIALVVSCDNKTPTVEKFTVTFDTDGGGQVLAQTVEKGYTAVEPKNPVKTGYEFKGWTLNDKSYDFKTPVTANITLKATWEKLANTVLVTFNSNGGTSIAPKAVEKGTTITAPIAPTRDGYVFKGWMLNDQAFTFDNPITTDITLVATWEWTGVRVKNEAELREAVLAEEANILIEEDFVLSDYIELKKPVTIDGNGKKVTVMFPGADYGGSGFMIQSEGVTLRDLTLESGETAKAQMALVYIHYASGTEEAPIVIEGCTLLCEQNTIGISSTYAAGDYLVIKDNYISDSKYGMYFNEIDNSLIEGNTIDRTKYNGIMIAGDNQTYPCENIVVKNNTLKNIATADYEAKTYATGIYVGINSAEVTVADSNDVDMYISANPEIHFGKDGVLVADKTQLEVAVADGKNVIICRDIQLDTTVKVEKDIKLNLNGHTITGNNVRALHFASGTSEITGEGSIKVVGTTINPGSSVIRVGDGSDWGNPSTDIAKLTIDENVTVETDACYAVSVFGSSTKEEIIVKGKLSGKAGLSTSGNENQADYSPVVTLDSTAEIKALDDYALYLPAAGSYTIDGTIEGPGAICTKAGNLTVDIGKSAIITATGTAGMEHEHGYANGPATKNYAVMVENNSAYGGPATVKINGGKITGSIGIYNDATYVPSENQKGTITVTGGTFTTDPFDYVAEEYFADNNSDGTYTVSKKGTREADQDDYNIFGTIAYAVEAMSQQYYILGYYEGVEIKLNDETEIPELITFKDAEITLLKEIVESRSEGVVDFDESVDDKIKVTLNGNLELQNAIDEPIIIFDLNGVDNYASINDDSHKLYARFSPVNQSDSQSQKVLIDDVIVTGLEEIMPYYGLSYEF